MAPAMPEALSALVHRTSFSWWDAIDILLVAILIYEALKLIRGTRAVQMAASSGILVLLFIASTTMPLQTVNWLIRNMVGYVVFAAIVLFQSDIRRALAHFGRAPFFRVLTRPDTGNETIEEVVVAASTLAGRRQGAIIVIEREIGLRNYIESGIPLDAQVTYDLLVSIFQPTGAAPRRRGHRPGGAHRRGLVLPAADRAAGAQPRARHAPPRRDRPDRGERRRRGGRVRGERADLDRARRHHRARPGARPSCGRGSRRWSSSGGHGRHAGAEPARPQASVA